MPKNICEPSQISVTFVGTNMLSIDDAENEDLPTISSFEYVDQDVKVNIDLVSYIREKNWNFFDRES